MNVRTLWLSSLLVVLTTLPACSSFLRPRVRLLTLNLVRPQGGALDLEETAQAIRETVPDLVSVGGVRGDEIATLGRLTGFQYVSSEPEDGDQLGVGVLTPWPVARTDRDRRAVAVDIDFKPLLARERRGSDHVAIPVVLACEYTVEEEATGTSRLMRPHPKEPSIRVLHHQQQASEAGDVAYELPFQWKEFEARRDLEEPIVANLRVLEMQAIITRPKEP